MVAQAELKALEAEYQALENEAEIKASDEYAEQVIRDTLKMAKPGETVVMLPNNENDIHESPPLEEESKREPAAVWRQWWELLVTSE